MTFPVFKGKVTTESLLRERQVMFMGVIAACVDFNRLAEFIILEVLHQGAEYSLEVYDVTPTDPLPGSSTQLGPRLLYGVGDLPQGDPMQVAKLIPPSNESMLQPHCHKSVQQINLTNSLRTYQLWCRFQGSDKARNMTAVFLGVIILVVAALLAAIGVSVTINTRRLREKTTALEMLKGRAEVAERNKGVLIANTAHELRTPIYGMEGMLKQLDEGGLDLGQREDVGAAGEEAERILRLVNAVLDVCKAEAGCLHLESVPFALRPWLRDVLHPHVQAAQERGLELTWCMDGDVPSVLVGDCFRLQQVVDRIVDNTIKFTASGGVCVRLQCLPPDTHIPTHLLSLGCLLAQPTPGCSSSAVAAAAATGAATAGAATAGAATADDARAAVHQNGVGERLFRMAFWEQMGQRGLARAVTGACNKRVFQRSLSAQCLRCYWRMPLVQEGGSEQEESEERGESKEREEGKERESVQEQIRGAPVIPLQHGVENGGEHLSVVGGRSSERVCSELSEGRGGAASLSLEDECGRRGKGPCEHGAGVRGGDVVSEARRTAPGGGGMGWWRGAVGWWWHGQGREEGREAEGGVGKRCMVLVACEDTGCGIAQEEQHDVFQAFMQTRAHGGNGMSLHLCRQLVSLMGGSIGLISTEGHGTTLHVALAMPVAAATAAVAVYGNSTSARTNVPGPATTCATSSSTAAADDTAVPRVVEMNSVRDCLKELLQGKAILPFSFPPPTPPLRSHPHYTHPACASCLAAPGGRRQRYQLHAISALHAHPLSHTRPCTPCAVQVVDNNAISRRVACHSVLPFSSNSGLYWTYPCAMQMVDDKSINRRQEHGISMPPFSSPFNPAACPWLCLCRWWMTTPCTPPCILSIQQVVDDNVINRRVAASTLAQYGAEVALAESGEAALRLL
ncbi:unnamed protein product [Closterium sp. NIES-65]|nr:unnamed protein product [Closterium sp. NIES-65]